MVSPPSSSLQPVSVSPNPLIQSGRKRADSVDSQDASVSGCILWLYFVALLVLNNDFHFHEYCCAMLLSIVHKFGTKGNGKP